MVLNHKTSSPETEFTEDLLSILHVFSCRMHGKRSYSKILENSCISDSSTESLIEALGRFAVASQLESQDTCSTFTVEYLKQPGTKTQWMKVALIIKSALPEWAKVVPYQIKNIAIRDACFAVRDAKKKTIKGEPSFVRFRSRKDRVQSIFVPSTAIKSKGVYHTILASLKLSQELPDFIRDSRLMKAPWAVFFMRIYRNIGSSH